MSVVQPVKLFAHATIWRFKEAFPDEFDSYGCGPGGLGDFFVPDTVYGLSIKPACQIHDTYYRHWPDASEEARQMIDRIFKNNMIRIVDHFTSPGLLRWLRRRRCLKYYLMVKRFGGPAFWEERNEDNQLQTI